MQLIKDSIHYLSYIICNEVTCRHIADLSLAVLYQPPLIIGRIDDRKLVSNSTLQNAGFAAAECKLGTVHYYDHKESTYRQKVCRWYLIILFRNI